MLQQILLALCDPTRREILKMLRSKERTVGEISARFDISPPAISRHLGVLREAELVFARREGKFIYYELNASVLEELLLWVAELKGDDEHDESDQTK